MPFWAYILRCADGKYYTGHTDELERRIAQHQSGTFKGFTHDRRPVLLVWSQEFGTRDEAKTAEAQVKPWSRAKKDALIAGDWAALKIAAIPPSEREARLGGNTHPPSLDFARDSRSGGDMAELELRNQPVRVEPASSEAETRRRDSHSPQPIVVLVRPQLAENIGKAARAMLNFGLSELRLVAPRDGWPNPGAFPAAAGADTVLENARIFDSVAGAVADCAHVYATTVRRRGVVKPVVDAEQAAALVRAAPERSAILFGPERSGLGTDDAALARTILTVPINPEFGSLNLAQAVVLVAYEWSKHVPSGAEGAERLAQPPAIALDPPASQASLDGLIGQLERALDDAHFFFPPARAPSARRVLRSLLTKPGWSEQEVRTLRGVVAALVDRRRR